MSVRSSLCYCAGIDDCVNIARVVTRMLEDGYTFTRRGITHIPDEYNPNVDTELKGQCCSVLSIYALGKFLRYHHDTIRKQRRGHKGTVASDYVNIANIGRNQVLRTQSARAVSLDMENLLSSIVTSDGNG